MNIQLDFHSEYTIAAGAHSVYDIVQSCYRIKGNKFENWFEDFDELVMENRDGEDWDALLEELADKIYLEEDTWIVCPLIHHKI